MIESFKFKYIDAQMGKYMYYEPSTYAHTYQPMYYCTFIAYDMILYFLKVSTDLHFSQCPQTDLYSTTFKVVLHPKSATEIETLSRLPQ